MGDLPTTPLNFYRYYAQVFVKEYIYYVQVKIVDKNYVIFNLAIIRKTKSFSSRCLFSKIGWTLICWREKPLSCCHSVTLYNLQTLQNLPHHFCYTLICFFLYLLNTYSLDSGAANKGKRVLWKILEIQNSWY